MMGADGAAYGLANEAGLRRESKVDVNAGKVDIERPYRPVTSRSGQPADTGY
jgi:hypothetical protein